MHVVRSPPSEIAAFSFAVVRVDPSRASLAAAGELDLAARDDLAALLAAEEAVGRTFIRLDLSKVTFMDCSCLGTLVAAHCRLLNRGGQLILTDVSGPVTRLLRATELAGRLLSTCEPDTARGGESA